MFRRPSSAVRPLCSVLSAILAFTAFAAHAADTALKADTVAKPPTPIADYILQPSDLLRIEVFQEDDLKREVRITQEHKISLPLIKEVDLHNKTLREAQILIRDLYNKDYLVNPQVTVSVIEYSKRVVNVVGQVTTPGVIEFPPEQGLTLAQAITRAGGHTRLADRKKVSLTRTTEDGRTEKTVVNVEDIVAGSAPDIPLMKDDIINVPEKLF